MFTLTLTDSCYQLEVGHPPFPYTTLTFFQLCHWWESMGIFNAHRADLHPVLTWVPPKRDPWEKGFWEQKWRWKGWEKWNREREKAKIRCIIMLVPSWATGVIVHWGYSEGPCRKFFRIITPSKRKENLLVLRQKFLVLDLTDILRSKLLSVTTSSPHRYHLKGMFLHR